MRILVAKNSGFCFGVRRAVDMAMACMDPVRTTYTYGDIIHNETVVAELEKGNVIPIRSMKDLKSGDRMIIRAHGVPPDVYREAEEKGIQVLDATCPLVRRIHRIVADEAEKGGTVLIAGEPDHPEVKGIRGWGGANSIVLQTEEEAERLPRELNGCLVSQTTMDRSLFARIRSCVTERCPAVRVHDTICSTTYARQAEAEYLNLERDRLE